MVGVTGEKSCSHQQSPPLIRSLPISRLLATDVVFSSGLIWIDLQIPLSKLHEKGVRKTIEVYFGKPHVISGLISQD